MKRLVIALACLVLAGGCTARAEQTADQARWWLTTADANHKLAEQRPLPVAVTGAAGTAITIDPSRKYQEIVGFGAAMTDASAELLSQLPEDKRQSVMAELFGTANDGIGLSFIRLTVGASDFSSTHYSYDDTPGNEPDPELKHFSIDPALKHVIPRTREALALNPRLRVMITPWSAPAWMKTTKSLIKGQLDPDHYGAFAGYLVRTVEEFDRAGVPVSMLSIQNEPDFEPGDYPGMRVNPPERATIIGRHVGPLLRSRGLKTQILEYDHNWDNPEMPLAVLSDPVAREYISGVAWHCYEGDVPAQSQVREAFPDKDVWFTECSGGEWAPEFGKTLGWMTSKLVIGATRHWAKGSLLWNLALDTHYGPHLGGCGNCRGVLMIDPASGVISRNVEYYVLGHASRFVRTGAKRIESTSGVDGVETVAFQNPDGNIVLIALNGDTGQRQLLLRTPDGAYSLALPAGAVATVTLNSSN